MLSKLLWSHKSFIYRTNRSVANLTSRLKPFLTSQTIPENSAGGFAPEVWPLAKEAGVMSACAAPMAAGMKHLAVNCLSSLQQITQRLCGFLSGRQTDSSSLWVWTTVWLHGSVAWRVFLTCPDNLSPEWMEQFLVPWVKCWGGYKGIGLEQGTPKYLFLSLFLFLFVSLSA